MTLTTHDTRTCLSTCLQDRVHNICAELNIGEDVFISEAIESQVDFLERQICYSERMNDSDFIFTHEPRETTNPAEIN